jgi:hypothetical protein
MAGQPLRQLHELLAEAGSSPGLRAAIAEAYVSGQAAAMPHLIAMREEVARLQPQVGGAPRKLASQADTARLLEALKRIRRVHPKWGRDKLAKEIAAALGDVDYRTVRSRLAELSQRPAFTLTIPLRPTTPLAAWVLNGN